MGNTNNLYSIYGLFLSTNSNIIKRLSFFESLFDTSGYTVLVEDNKNIYELIRDYVKEETGKDLPVGVPYKMEVSVGLTLSGEMIVYDDGENKPSDDFGFSPSCLCSADIRDQETPEL